MERLRVQVFVDEDPAIENLATNGLEGPRGHIELREVASVWNLEQGPVQVVGPAVVLAAQPLGRATLLTDDWRAAVLAGVEESPEASIVSPYDQERRARSVDGTKTARPIELFLSPDQ